MATRSLIAIQREEDSYDAVYCHFDGYPEGVGQILKESYTTSEKVNLLIEGGAMSSLNGEIEKCDYYTKYGDKLHIYRSLNFDYLKKRAKDLWCEYLYIFNNELTWNTIRTNFYG